MGVTTALHHAQNNNSTTFRKLPNSHPHGVLEDTRNTGSEEGLAPRLTSATTTKQPCSMISMLTSPAFNNASARCTFSLLFMRGVLVLLFCYRSKHVVVLDLSFTFSSSCRHQSESPCQPNRWRRRAWRYRRTRESCWERRRGTSSSRKSLMPSR